MDGRRVWFRSGCRGEDADLSFGRKRWAEDLSGRILGQPLGQRTGNGRMRLQRYVWTMLLTHAGGEDRQAHASGCKYPSEAMITCQRPY